MRVIYQPITLGTSLILGGEYYWPGVFGLFLAVVIVLWRMAALVVGLESPIRCLLAFEIINSIIAGTFDTQIFCAFNRGFGVIFEVDSYFCGSVEVISMQGHQCCDLFV